MRCCAVKTMQPSPKVALHTGQGRCWSLSLAALILVAVFLGYKAHYTWTCVAARLPATAQEAPEVVVINDYDHGAVQGRLQSLRSTVGPWLRTRLLPSQDDGRPLSCAVVGDSASLYLGPRLYASEIEQHDVVIQLPPVFNTTTTRDGQAKLKGTKATFEVHHMANKTEIAIERHSVCGKHDETPLLVSAELCTPANIEYLTWGCVEREVERDFRCMSVSEWQLMLDFHEAVVHPMVGAMALPFTEEWMATYVVCQLTNYRSRTLKPRYDFFWGLDVVV